MTINILFTPDEKKKFLIKNGFDLVDYNHDVWDQWGSNDSQGKWKIEKYVCATKGDESPKLDNEFSKVFEKLISNKLKNFILEL